MGLRKNGVIYEDPDEEGSQDEKTPAGSTGGDSGPQSQPGKVKVANLTLKKNEYHSSAKILARLAKPATQGQSNSKSSLESTEKTSTAESEPNDSPTQHRIFFPPYPKVTYPDGSYYIGQTQNSYRHGLGMLYLSNHSKSYEGEWFLDLRQGLGISYHPNSSKSYSGHFASNKFHGYGIKFSLSNTEACRGYFKNNILIKLNP